MFAMKNETSQLYQRNFIQMEDNKINNLHNTLHYNIAIYSTISTLYFLLTLITLIRYVRDNSSLQNFDIIMVYNNHNTI